MLAASFTFAEDLRALILIGGVAAFVAAGLTLAWLAIMVFLPAPPKGSTSEEELDFIAGHDGVQIARFLPTTLVAFLYIPTWLGLGALLWDEAPTAAALAMAFGLLYPATTATGYWMQYTVIRGFAKSPPDAGMAAATVYELIGFHERPTSLSASGVILGYTFWSLGGVAAGIALLSHGGRFAATTGILFLVTAALMFIGVAGHIARSRILTMGVFLSGVASLGATIATALLLISQV